MKSVKCRLSWYYIGTYTIAINSKSNTIFIVTQIYWNSCYVPIHISKKKNSVMNVYQKSKK